MPALRLEEQMKEDWVLRSQGFGGGAGSIGTWISKECRLAATSK